MRGLKVLGGREGVTVPLPEEIWWGLTLLLPEPEAAAENLLSIGVIFDLRLMALTAYRTIGGYY